MRKLILLAILFTSFTGDLLASEKTQATAEAFTQKLFAGDIEGAKKLSSVPFSFDRKDLIKDQKDLDKFFKKVTDQNGKLKIEIVSSKKVEDRKGVHKELKDEFTIYQIQCRIKGATATLKIFVRKSDGKVVGLFG